MVRGCGGCGCLHLQEAQGEGAAEGAWVLSQNKTMDSGPKQGVWGGRTADQRRLSGGTTELRQHSRPKQWGGAHASRGLNSFALAELHSLQGLSSPFSDGMCVPCFRSAEASPLDHQASPRRL